MKSFTIIFFSVKFNKEKQTKERWSGLSFDEKIKSFTIGLQLSIFKSSETDLLCPQNTINVKNSKGEQNFWN